MTVTLTALLT